MNNRLSPKPWIVELRIADSDGARWVSLITESYDGTAQGARHWAADVFDYVEVLEFGLVRQLRGEIVNSLENA